MEPNVELIDAVKSDESSKEVTAGTKRKSADDIRNDKPKKSKQSDKNINNTENNGLPTYNPFDLLNNDENLSSLNAKENARINKETFQRQRNAKTATIKQEKCPPIIITQLFSDPKGAINAIQEGLKGKAIFKIQRDGYNVQTESTSDYDVIKQKLVEKKIPFYTFTSKENKLSKFVVKGIHWSYTSEEIKEELVSQNTRAQDVQPMLSKDKKQLSMFTVSFPNGTKLDDIKIKSRYVCNQKVTWQPFVKKNIGTQCRKCQGFGHAASNCGQNYR